MNRRILIGFMPLKKFQMTHLSGILIISAHSNLSEQHLQLAPNLSFLVATKSIYISQIQALLAMLEQSIKGQVLGWMQSQGLSNAGSSLVFKLPGDVMLSLELAALEAGGQALTLFQPQVLLKGFILGAFMPTRQVKVSNKSERAPCLG